jgi:hypothetical protein
MCWANIRRSNQPDVRRIKRFSGPAGYILMYVLGTILGEVISLIVKQIKTIFRAGRVYSYVCFGHNIRRSNQPNVKRIKTIFRAGRVYSYVFLGTILGEVISLM